MKLIIISFCTLSFLLTSCANIGRPFDFAGPHSLIIGKTTQKEVASKYGDPFRMGYDSGKVQWTYAHYQYRVFGDTDTKDLVIVFDEKGLVSSYIYNSSLPEDKTAIMSK